ncbi:response regulator transcription factor [Kitasatospora sp. NPDC004745]|uniref:response regulator transcription factor n=1 Tax=Kitasatospora sp. NPDC004745 TaxID=3364019 RepID=UPI0036CB57E1
MSRLTDRQRDVLLLIAEGCTNTEIARRLGISVRAVETRTTRLLIALDARGRANAVHCGYQAGILTAEKRRHGDHAGFRQHESRGERPCTDCRAAETAYKRAIRHRSRSAA